VLNTCIDVAAGSRIEKSGGHETVGEILRELRGVVTQGCSETTGSAASRFRGSLVNGHL
jgi:hypothetical protein